MSREERRRMAGAAFAQLTEARRKALKPASEITVREALEEAERELRALSIALGASGAEFTAMGCLEMADRYADILRLNK